MYLLIATIPERRVAVNRILPTIPQQTLKPEQICLVLDGYGDSPSPPVPPLPVREWRTAQPSGPGARWRVVKELPANTTVINVDDDMIIFREPGLFERLTKIVEGGCAAATTGITVTGKVVTSDPRDVESKEDLICGVASVMSFRAGWLSGLDDMAEVVRTRCGFDPLGDCGDDEALVSACLWRHGIRMKHAFSPGLLMSTDVQNESQSRRRHDRGDVGFEQRRKISHVTGWPWYSHF